MISLADTTVLVTRPIEPARSLCQAIADAGGRAVCAPMIEINSRANDIATQAKLADIDEYREIIFVSPNAVEFAIQGLSSTAALMERRIHAVGAGTARRLSEHGFEPVISPLIEQNSDGLLRLRSLEREQINGAKVLIIRGLGGRERLARELRSRGARVDYCEVYERTPPDAKLTESLGKTAVDTLDIAVLTSVEGARNFATKITTEHLLSLYDLPLLVVGERIASVLRELGFTNAPVIVDNPSDDAVLKKLGAWKLGEL